MELYAKKSELKKIGVNNPKNMLESMSIEVSKVIKDKGNPDKNILRSLRKLLNNLIFDYNGSVVASVSGRDFEDLGYDLSFLSDEEIETMVSEVSGRMEEEFSDYDDYYGRGVEVVADDWNLVKKSNYGMYKYAIVSYIDKIGNTEKHGVVKLSKSKKPVDDTVLFFCDGIKDFRALFRRGTKEFSISKVLMFVKE